MSHTSSISAIKIVDINALKQAVQDLNGMGITVTLVENKKPVAYSHDQPGMSEVAPYCLEIKEATYDVGIYDIGAGQFEARTDFYNGSVAAALGADRNAMNAIDRSTAEGKAEMEYAQLGKLYQRYSINATKNQAARQGGNIQEIVQADGSVQLVITGMAA